MAVDNIFEFLSNFKDVLEQPFCVSFSDCEIVVLFTPQNIADRRARIVTGFVEDRQFFQVKMIFRVRK